MLEVLEKGPELGHVRAGDGIIVMKYHQCGMDACRACGTRIVEKYGKSETINNTDTLKDSYNSFAVKNPFFVPILT